jgi:myo-inositol-1(or 4)-monophosphatase
MIDVKNSKANPRDIVTEADSQCQQVIQSILSNAFPNDSFLGEESVGTGSDASIAALSGALGQSSNSYSDDASSLSSDDELVFVVDPIDGTTNFQAGLPMFCASIGAVHKATGDIVLGVIYNSILDEMTYAVRGQGAFTNGKRLGIDVDVDVPPSTSTIIPLQEAVINVGFPTAKESTLEVSSRAIQALATKVRGLRMIASASQVMAWVAQGKFNAYVSWDLNSWDVCAGMVIMEESQGFVSDLEGKRATVRSRDLIVSSAGSRANNKEDVDNAVVAGDQGVHGELLKVFIENNCVTYGSK